MSNVIREENEWFFDIAPINDTINQLTFTINRLEDTNVRGDMTRMLRNLEALRDDISRETVRCRGFNRTTGTMQNLEKSFTEAEKVVTQFLTVALLQQ